VIYFFLEYKNCTNSWQSSSTSTLREPLPKSQFVCSALFVGGFVFLFKEGYIEIALQWIASVGIWGQLILIGLFIPVCYPWALGKEISLCLSVCLSVAVLACLQLRYSLSFSTLKQSLTFCVRLWGRCIVLWVPVWLHLGHDNRFVIACWHLFSIWLDRIFILWDWLIDCF
jgi:hypothetical protein